MNDGERNVFTVKKRLLLCLKGNRLTRVLEEGFSVAQKGLFLVILLRWVFNNFESWRSRVDVEKSFLYDVLCNC